MDIDQEFERIDARLAGYYTPRERAVWWSSSHPLLKGERAMTALNDARQADLHRILDAMDSGAYL